MAKVELSSSLSNEYTVGKAHYVFKAGKVDVQVASDMKQVKASDHLMVMVDDVTGTAPGKDGIAGDRAGVAELGNRIGYVQSTEGGENMTHEFGHLMGLNHNWLSPGKDDDGKGNYMSYDANKNSFSGGQLYRSMLSELNQGSNSSTLSAPGMTTQTTNQTKPHYKAQEGERVPRPIYEVK